MRLILSAFALMGALAAGTASTCSTPQVHKVVANPDGGFGRGYGVFHSYGWARGTAGYRNGICYWHPEPCSNDDD